MNGAQTAHFLKAVRKGSEPVRMDAIIRACRLVGADRTRAAADKVYRPYRFGGRSCTNPAEHPQEHGMTTASAG